MNIGELADAVGITRRAVRFYVQQKLLPPPLGVGRGDHYDATHLAALRRIVELQQAGHSLAAIARILGSGTTSEPVVERPTKKATGDIDEPIVIQTSLYTRLQIAPGVELHFDATRHSPDLRTLQKVRRFVRKVFESRG